MSHNCRMAAQTDEHGGDLPVEKGTVTNYPGLGCNHCPAAFFKQESHTAHMAERHPDKPVAEAWESSPEHQVTYYPNLTRQHPHFYLLSDKQSGKYLSNIVIGHTGEVEGLETDPKHRRQGHAKELWNAVNEHAETTPGVPTPRHSKLRTRAGEGWAKAVGGEVPERTQSLLSARQMKGMIDFKNQ